MGTVRKKRSDEAATERGRESFLRGLLKAAHRKLMRDNAADEEKEFIRITRSLTNWQCNQWARAGYPGLHARDPEKIRPFSEMKRRPA